MSKDVIVVFLVMAFFLLGFISVCIRRRAASTPENYDSRRFIVASTTSLWRSHGRLGLGLGLDRSVIESFPVFSYSEVIKDRWIGNGGGGGGGSLECAVCISEFVDGEKVRKLPKCSHVFHPGCIDVWFAFHTSCPVCRKDQSPEPNVDGSIIDYERMEAESGSEATTRGLQNHDQVSITVLNSDENEVKTMKFSRSNSTGHEERYTKSSQLKRTKSCGVILSVVMEVS